MAAPSGDELRGKGARATAPRNRRRLHRLIADRRGARATARWVPGKRGGEGADQLRAVLRHRFATAVRSNLLTDVRECLKLDAALANHPIAEGTTALSIAVHKHYDELALLLLQYGANVNATTRYAAVSPPRGGGGLNCGRTRIPG